LANDKRPDTRWSYGLEAAQMAHVLLRRVREQGDGSAIEQPTSNPFFLPGGV